jgi:hypothetical protein
MNFRGFILSFVASSIEMLGSDYVNMVEVVYLSLLQAPPCCHIVRREKQRETT